MRISNHQTTQQAVVNLRKRPFTPGGQGPVASAGSNFVYKRPGGVDNYKRPGGVDTYKRP